MKMINKHSLYFTGLGLLSIGFGLVGMSTTPVIITLGVGIIFYSALLAMVEADS